MQIDGQQDFWQEVLLSRLSARSDSNGLGFYANRNPRARHGTPWDSWGFITTAAAVELDDGVEERP